jgi:hypothetical protein
MKSERTYRNFIPSENFPRNNRDYFSPVRAAFRVFGTE